MVEVLDCRAGPEANASAIERTVECLARGQLVALPTETVYGLAARADDDEAVAAIFTAKGRPSSNPLIVHVPDLEAARATGVVAPAEDEEMARRAEALAERFWPGPLTLVLPRGPLIGDGVTAGLDTVGIRAPQHPVFRAVLEAAPFPLAAPSANPSEAISPTRADHVVDSLGDRPELALVLDGGTCVYGLESTIVDLTATPPRVLRHGALPLSALRPVVPSIVDATRADGREEDAPKSPGRMPRHYAPRARLEIVSSDELGRRANEARNTPAEPNSPTRVLSLEPAAIGHTPPHWVVHAMPNEPRAYAAELYGRLHDADRAGCAVILVEAVPTDEDWSAVRDRLQRASVR